MWGGRTLVRGGAALQWGRSMGAWGPLMWRWGSDVLSRGRNLWAVVVLAWGSWKIKEKDSFLYFLDYKSQLRPNFWKKKKKRDLYSEKYSIIIHFSQLRCFHKNLNKLEDTHGLTGNLKRPWTPLLAASFKVDLTRCLRLGGDLTVAGARPGGLQAGPLPCAAGQVVVWGGMSQLGAGLPATPGREASRGRLAQGEVALLLLGVQRGGGVRQPQHIHLQGFGAPTRRFYRNALTSLSDLLALCADLKFHSAGHTLHSSSLNDICSS